MKIRKNMLFSTMDTMFLILVLLQLFVFEKTKQDIDFSQKIKSSKFVHRI